MRTAHLIVSATAFVAFLAAYIVHVHNCPGDGRVWYLFGPLSVLPAVWSILGLFITRRASRLVRLSQLGLACLILCFALLALRNSLYEWVFLPDDSRPVEYLVIRGVSATCCWVLAAPLGLIAFVWAIACHIGQVSVPHDEEA